MKTKPSGTYYLIPIAILFISIFLAVFLFFRGVMSPLMDTTEIEINQSFTQELSSGSFVSLFIEDEDMIDYSIEEFDGYYVLTYTTNSDTHSVQIEILNDSSLTPTSGFNFEEFEYTTAYTIDNHINFADINIEDTGSYIITISTYNDIPASFAYSVVDFEGDVGFIFTALAVGFFGFLISLILFIIIMVKRSKAKRLAYTSYSYNHIPEPQPLGSQYYQPKEEEKKDDYDF
jgi:hypothetical protein